MTTLLTIKETALRLNINPARLKRWVDFGYVRPEYQAVAGKRIIRLFSDKDIQFVKTVIEKLNNGHSLREICNQEA